MPMLPSEINYILQYRNKQSRKEDNKGWLFCSIPYTSLTDAVTAKNRKAVSQRGKDFRIVNSELEPLDI